MKPGTRSLLPGTALQDSLGPGQLAVIVDTEDLLYGCLDGDNSLALPAQDPNRVRQEIFPLGIVIGELVQGREQ